MLRFNYYYQENQFILAEAKFMQGDEAGARQHLNNVRADQKFNIHQMQLVSQILLLGTDLHLQILEEKYIILIGEIVTFHDLRRTRNAISVPNKQGLLEHLISSEIFISSDRNRYES